MTDPNHSAGLQYKKLAFLTPLQGLARIDFEWYWREIHGPTVASAPDYVRYRCRYIQNHVVGPGPVGSPFTFAGMAEFWLPSINEDVFAQTSTYLDHINPDERRFIDMDRTISVTAVEDVLLQGTGPLKLIVLAGGSSPAIRDLETLKDLVKGYVVNRTIENSSRLPGARIASQLPIATVHEIWFGSMSDLHEALSIHEFSAMFAWNGTDALQSDALSSFLAQEITFFDEGKPVRGLGADGQTHSGQAR